MMHFRVLALLALLAAVAPLTYAASANVQVGGGTCTVVPLGGGQDDGPNILDAFSQCASGGTVVLNEYYVVNTVLVTTGLKNVNIELSGVVQYTPNIAYWSPNSLFLTYQNATTYWFLSGDNIHLYGGGTLDGNGQVWWDYPNATSGTAGGSSTLFARPIPLTVGNASNVVIEDLTQIQSPFWNNFVYQSTNVTYRNINISTVSYSSNPTLNSDGWDIYRSSFVTIENSTVNNDDDCVSFKPNATNILVQNMNCLAGDGMSVGSLGQYAGETDIVANVTVNNVTLTNSQNGGRVKVFGGSPLANSTAGGGGGYVKNITFSNFQVNSVDYPIVFDECFATPVSCVDYPTKIAVSDVHYSNFSGTSSGAEGTMVVDLNCTMACTDITAGDINLTSPNGAATYFCRNVTSTSELDFNCTDSV
ncbi:glycoside hydrolase family 28 protein [Serpula lacrymans var. lacrymans S7.3]|uniref:galacturonan 1,4-alpha-galacturonidase n=1 Tax=Serpula lacrymans var. lacrymans (strain S7.3) TaxID=936435 RepID=F8Q309_SERL3|nr:glycoside hydrolase family 28 protein [Serpula lacrymans var. lacrymans S7.3]